MPFTSVNICFSNFGLRHNVKQQEIQTTARPMDAYASGDSTSQKQPCVFDNAPFAQFQGLIKNDT